MTTTDGAHDWDGSYAGPPPPWDIGRRQAVFARLADAGALTGAFWLADIVRLADG